MRFLLLRLDHGDLVCALHLDRTTTPGPRLPRRRCSFLLTQFCRLHCLPCSLPPLIALPCPQVPRL